MRDREYVPYKQEVTVTENRAATDDSIRILNEMTEKAKQNLCHTVHINQVFLSGLALFFQTEPLGGFEVFYKFSLNGEEFKFKTNVSEDEFDKEALENPHTPYRNIAIRLVHEKFVEEFSKQLIKHQLQELNKDIRFRQL